MTYQIELHLSGMHDHACECSVNNTLRHTFDTKKVVSSAAEGSATILAAHKIPESDLHDVLDPTGYRVLEYTCSICQTRHFWQNPHPHLPHFHLHVYKKKKKSHKKKQSRG